MLSKCIALVFALFISNFTIANTMYECKARVERVITENNIRLKNPKYAQVLKSVLDEDLTVPIIDNVITLYKSSNMDYFNKLTNKANWDDLFRGETVTFSTIPHPNSTFLIYPIKNMKRTYITGFLFLSYDKNIELNEELEIGIEVIGTYLSQILDNCKGIKNEKYHRANLQF